MRSIAYFVYVSESWLQKKLNDRISLRNTLYYTSITVTLVQDLLSRYFRAPFAR